MSADHAAYPRKPSPARTEGPGALSYARVALNRPLDPLTYYIPESLSDQLRVGALVEVPLRNETAAGVIVDIVDEPGTKHQLKPVARRLSADFSIENSLIELGRWLSEYYFCSLGEALACMSFIGLNDLSSRTRTAVTLADPEHWLSVSREAAPDGKKVTATQQKVIAALLAETNRPQTPRELAEAAGVSEAVPRLMLEHDWLIATEEEILRLDDYPLHDDGDPRPLKLTDTQAEVLKELLDPLHAGRYQTFLLHGVTGSGKTELYLRVIEDALKIGRTAIVLVPEIALTPQTVQSFRRRLGSTVGVYHSRLSLGQKFDLWKRIKTDEVRVVIGARSALFAPLPSLGAIIVDEEHESTYKQGETPRYHARDVAVMRGSRENAVVILGSATPSAESLHNAREGKYKWLRLPERIGPHAPPVMNVIDMKRHWRQGQIESAGESMLSPPLRDAIAKRLEVGEQVMLLLNRRGFANQILCMACGKLRMCPDCDVPMTYHKTVNRLMCHWCGYKTELPKVCPECGAEEIKNLGMGTQRIEEVLAELYPQARIQRIDTDSMRRQGAFSAAWEKINRHEIDIILGTQMIAKGLHLEQVTLVGVILADFALFMPDFRSAERTYSLLTQMAGRAGRGSIPGEVIVQSFMPQHYAIDTAARLAEEAFYERELKYRRMLRFPPFGKLVAITVSGTDPEFVRDMAFRFGGLLKPLTYRPDYHGIRVLGPTPAPLGKLEGQWRWRLLARGERPGPLHALVREGLAQFNKAPNRARIHLTIDADPFDLM
ncbi:primosomal protein N' [bacterium]|nr:primosomal protein N' [bacterium]